MDRTICISGVGKASRKPDLIIVPISLTAQSIDYNDALLSGEKKLDSLKAALASAGFDRKELKTNNYSVRPEYESVRDRNGNYTQVFKGYCYHHDMKIEFDYDTARLAVLFNALMQSECEPVFNVEFSVKDREAFLDEILENAAKNARIKAETLCRASGVKLGQLVKVDYSWGEVYLRSNTAMDMCMKIAAPMAIEDDMFDIEPEDISRDETVTFVWEIE